MFSPITSAADGIKNRIERSIGSGANDLKSWIKTESEKFNPDARDRVSYSQHAGRVWRFAGGAVIARFAGSWSISSDSCCVTSSLNAQASVVGKIPTNVPGLTFRPSGSVRLSASAEYCWTKDTYDLNNATLTLQVAFAARFGSEVGSFGQRVEMFAEAGIYFRGSLDLIEGSRSYQAGVFARAVFGVEAFGFYTHKEVKYSSGGGFIGF